MSLIAVWLILAFVAGAVEILVPAFGFVFVGVAALVGAAVAAIGLAWPFQAALFAITLVLSLVLLRPLFTRRLGGRGIPSRTEALVGRRGQLIEAVDPVVGTGRVNVGGEDWAARSRVPIPAGAEVVVEGADGIVLIVGPVSTTIPA